MSIEKHKFINLFTFLHLKRENSSFKKCARGVLNMLPAPRPESFGNSGIISFNCLINLVAISISLLFFTGCAGINVNQRAFTPIAQKENSAILKKLQEKAKKIQLGKCKLKLYISTNLDGNKKNYNARAVCLWQPGKKIRMRISHILAGTIADILFDGKIWYITDEQNGKIYISKRIDTIRIAGFPDSFFIQMQRLPETWLPANGSNITIGENENSYQIRSQKSGEEFDWIFQRSSAFPSEMKIETGNNGTLIAAFSAPETNILFRAGMFKPILNDYEMIKLD